MANLIKYDRQAVVDKCCELFWSQGFHATSTRDIQRAVDMRPGSIYSAFGSKEGLYAEALQSYAIRMGQQLSESLDEADTVLSGLEAFVRRLLIHERDLLANETCMLVKAQSEPFEKGSPLLLLSQSLLTDFENNLCVFFNKAQHSNELPAQIAAIEYARYFQIHFSGLRMYLKRGDDTIAMDQLITQMFKLLRLL